MEKEILKQNFKSTNHGVENGDTLNQNYNFTFRYRMGKDYPKSGKGLVAQIYKNFYESVMKRL
jgi:hypothetical protein